MRRLIWAFIIISTFSCKNEDSNTLIDVSEFNIEEGNTIELVASEPLLDSPMSMTFDDQGRLWAVEMPGYMRDIDGNDEALPDGRIVILEDINEDGIYDKRKVFLDNLTNPRALSLVYDGLLYTDSTALVWTQIKKDLAVNKVLVDSFYINGGNIEHQPNGLVYNLDNWIYSAKSNVRYKRSKNGRWLKEATSFRGQWGISADALGRLVYNHNSAPLISDGLLPNVILNNPYLEINHNVGNYLTKDMRLYPIQATSVNRGYEEGTLDSLGKLINYTSACSPYIFFGDGLDKKYDGSAFVCAPEANLISRYDYNPINQKANKRENYPEFLSSKDESFRPIQILTGFDGALYILDLRKGIIQHSAYMSSYLRERILNKGLEKITGKGRVYKITSNQNNKKAIRWDTLEVKDLPYLLKSSNKEVRIRAQQKILNQPNKIPIDVLLKFANNPHNKYASIHAWYILDELNLIDKNSIHNLNIDQITQEFSIAVLPILKKYATNWVYESRVQFIDIYRKMLDFKIKSVDINLAVNLGGIPNYWPELYMLAERYPNDSQIIEALVAGIHPFEESYLNTFKRNYPNLSLFRSEFKKAIQNKEEEIIMTPQLAIDPEDDDRTNGLTYFKKYCASCHGIDGKGQKKVAPSLVSSIIVKGPEKELAKIILNGYHSGSTEFQMLMPKYKDDPNMTDKDISDIVSYLVSTFARKWGGVSPDEICDIRTEIIIEDIQNQQKRQ